MQRLTLSPILLSASFLFCAVQAAAAEKIDMKNPVPYCRQLAKQGLHQDALDILRPWVLDPKSAELDDKTVVPQAIPLTVGALRQLNRLAEFDAFLEKAAEVHRENWRALESVAFEYISNFERGGTIVDGVFRRGDGSGGRRVFTNERDRVIALRHARDAMPLARNDADKKAVADFFRKVADALTDSRETGSAWKLQRLTDLERLPDFEETPPWFGGFGGDSRAPTDADGRPVFYGVPESFEAAKNDGERWRWALNRVVENDPSRQMETLQRRAEFNRSQFGEQTLRGLPFFQPRQSEDETDRQASIWSLRTLGDNETIARLATGIRRFELPDEFNPITLYRTILAFGESDDDKIHAAAAIAEIYENRMQFVRAADLYRMLLERYPGEASQYPWKTQLDRIVGNWGGFEPTESKVVGADAELRYVFRNGNKVELTAHEIRIPVLIGDIKAYLKSKPDRLEWNRTLISEIGWQLILGAGDVKAAEVREKYLGPEVARWSVALNPAEKHFDRRTTIAVPVKKAGAYLVRADMEGGNTEYIVLWLDDTALVKKQLDGAILYFVADAESGRPVSNATLDFLGYRMERSTTPRPGGRRRQADKPDWTILEYSRQTDADGLFVLEKEDDGNRPFQWLVTAKDDRGRFAYLGFDSIWFRKKYDPIYQATKAFVITDRPVYRPGDKVEIKCWVGTAKYDLPNTNEWAGKTVGYEIDDPRGEKIAEQADVKLDAYGGLVAAWELPKGATLGMYRIRIPGHGGGTFRVEEYRKPEYEVSVDAPKEPARLGETIKATIRAQYYFGSPVTEATVQYKVLREQYADAWFPWRPWDWLYGSGYGWLACDADWLPGWRHWGVRRPAPSWLTRVSGPPEVVAEQEVPIGADGTVEIAIDTSLAQAMFPDASQRYSITAEVVDRSRRTIVGGGEVLVSKEPFSVYAWVDRGYYAPGQKIEARFQARRLDGKPVSGAAAVNVFKILYQEPDAERSGASGFLPVETEVHATEIRFDDRGEASLSLNAAEPGQYRVSCTLDGREGGYVFSVYSNDSPEAPLRSASGSLNWKFNALELIPERPEYAPGETVALRVNTDRDDATVLLFVKPSGGVCLPPRLLKDFGRSHQVEIPVEMRDMPNFFVEALTVSGGRVVDEIREIVVPPQTRVLNVDVTPSAETYKPGAPAKAELTVTDLAGTPVSGQIVVSIYDKSVEYIWDQHGGGSNVGDIREFFWNWRRNHHANTQSSLERHFLNMPEPNQPGMEQLGIFRNVDLDAGPPAMGGFLRENSLMRGGAALEMEDVPMAAAPMMQADLSVPMQQGNFKLAEPTYGGFMAEGQDAGGGETVEPTVRKNFADTALWIGALETDENGRAPIELAMPESLTTWKINVWAMSPGTRVGCGTAEVITRKDLILRMQTPRFLVEKDQCVFSANVHNYLPNEKQVKVLLDLKSPERSEAEFGNKRRNNPEAALRCASGSLEQVVRIPAGGEARVDWLVEAKTAGEATVVMKALTDEESDAMQKTLPVYVHGMLKQEAWSGYIAPDKESGSVEIRVPEERKPEQTKLTVRFSPTLAASMVDALPYLVDYPYGCTEQTLNRFLPTVIVQNVLKAGGWRLEAGGNTNLNAQELGEGRKPAPARKVEPVYDVEQVREMVADGVTKLSNMQCSDGGWGWFGGYGERSSAHLTALVVHGLTLAKENGADVDDEVLSRGLAWLSRYQDEQYRLLMNDSVVGKDKTDLRRKTRADETDAFVFMVLPENDRPSHRMNDFLWRDRAKLSLYGVAMYGVACQSRGDLEKARACVRMLEQYLVQDEENQTAWLNLARYSGWSRWCWHGSEFETQAYYLKLLTRTDPQSPVAPRLVKYLLNNRRHATYWNSTRDTAIVIEAFAEFLRATGEDKPEMTVEVLFDGRVKKTVDITPENLPAIDNTLILQNNTLGADEISSGVHRVELRKKGKGPLYFNAYLENFTLEDPIKKTGLEVKIERRMYKLVRDESAKTQAAGGRGQVVDMKVEKYNRLAVDPGSALHSGDLVEIELVVESKNDYESIIIEDMKAAGLEPVDLRSGYTGNELGAYVEFRDERVAMFVYRLPRGKHSVTYRLRAEQPGSFGALPAKISAMYAPELKGNSDENKVRVVDRPPGEAP